ncbi:exo-alpha-sialidase, partial [candidate division KSB1 bacterium]|nr:exo-alpha-sialidase [candidate division KSB1 bacterium]
MTINKISRFALIFMILGAVTLSTSISQTLAQTVVTEIPNPAGENTEEANLYADDNGNVYLTWIKKGEKRVSSLMFSKFEDGDWSSARKIAEGNDWFVNWADFPSLISTPDGKFAAHWLAKSDVGTYAYDVNIARSLDGGKSWSEPLLPHSDGTPTEHGFVSMLPWDDESFFAMWLDG